jgi:hypothetical protein
MRGHGAYQAIDGDFVKVKTIVHLWPYILGCFSEEQHSEVPLWGEVN